MLHSTIAVQARPKYATATTIFAINSVTSTTAHKIKTVIDPETGASLEYRHLMQGTTKDI